jgi:regulator of sigma E protease
LDLVYFTLLISVLIFIHEMGHFAFAKIFGVKVLTFSIGFGPKLIRIRGKETEYCIGILPLGGFVKMLEESKVEKEGKPIAPEDKKRTFEAQALYKRVLIVLAGPAMNVIFPIALYTSTFLDDREVLPPVVGTVVDGMPADGKLLPGDTITSIDGKPITSFPEVQRAVMPSAGRPMRLGVRRDGRDIEIDITPADEAITRELDIVEHVGRLGTQAIFPVAVIGVPRPDTPAYRAGLRTFDRIIAVNGRKVDRFYDLVSMLAQNKGETVMLSFLRPSVQAGELFDLAVMETGVAQLTPSRGSELPPTADFNERAADVLARTGIESSDLYVAFVPEGSSEHKAGLRRGDRISALDGIPQKQWIGLHTQLVRGADASHRLEWTRDGEPMAGTFMLRHEQWDDEFGQHYDRYVFRTSHWLPGAESKLVPNPKRIRWAVDNGLTETWRVIKFVAIGFLRLVQGRISLSSVSGPITIYDIAGQAGAKGTGTFVRVMALISVNLGLVNLLPIPVLDGGHLFFMLTEAIRRRPLTRRTREIASLIGMTVLFALMLLAFKNDVERHWDVIVTQVRDLFGKA